MGALVSSSVVTQAVALVAAGIIAPAFEPLVRIVLAATNRHANIMRQALSSTLLSFGVLIAISAVTMLVLRAGSPAFVADFVHNQTVRGVQHPAAINLMISAGGAVAGVVMVAWPSTSPWCSSRPPATSPISTSPLTVADASRGDHAPGGGSHERSFCLALM